jgi:hypothetical protein
MKKVKTMGVGLAGFALAVLIAINVQGGINESVSNTVESSSVIKKPIKKEGPCPDAADVCTMWYIPGQGWLPLQGKPITVTG